MHINITLPDDLKVKLDRAAKRERLKRSTLIQKAVRVYISLKERQNLNDLLKQGYQEMASESEKMARDFEALDNESLKDVD